VQVHRLGDGPIIHPQLDASIGRNINGPSLIRAPAWLSRPLGRYYLYFASHTGRYIRLAVADALSGPWRVHAPGTLQLAGSHCIRHVASPDVHVDPQGRRIVMYYHGPDESEGRQVTRVAVSGDGLAFAARPQVLGPSYFRVFRHDGWHYALAMPGIFLRSADGLSRFEPGPQRFEAAGVKMRHSAVCLRGRTLHVFYSRIGDCPEHILHSTVELSGDWMDWRPTEPTSVLKPETAYEGADQPLEPSVAGLARTPVRQLCDPAVFEEDARTYLLYSVAGESGIAIAELEL
jgi:hypothetical protein